MLRAIADGSLDDLAEGLEAGGDPNTADNEGTAAVTAAVAYYSSYPPASVDFHGEPKQTSVRIERLKSDLLVLCLPQLGLESSREQLIHRISAVLLRYLPRCDLGCAEGGSSHVALMLSALALRATHTLGACDDDSTSLLPLQLLARDA